MIRLVLALLASAADARSIHNSNGGVFLEFQKAVDQRTRRGDKFIIDGRCDSSCVMHLAVPGTCITRRAVLGLHGAVTSGKIDALMSSAYHCMCLWSVWAWAILRDDHGCPLLWGSSGHSQRRY